MSQSIGPQLNMLSVLLNIEKRPILPLDNALLGTVAGACQTIGSQIITALEGEQRGIFQDLCAYITEENINRVDQILPVSDSAWSDYRLLMIECMGFGLVSQYAVTKVYRSRRRIGITFRLVSPRALYARIRHTKVATALAARRSTVKQVTIAEDRKENDSYNPSHPSLTLSPAFAPLPLDDLCRMGPSTGSEGAGHIVIDSNDPPSTAKRNASPDGDENSEASLHTSQKIKNDLHKMKPSTASKLDSDTAIDSNDPPSTVKRKASLEDDDGKSNASLHPSKKIKSGLSLADSRQIDNKSDLADAGGNVDLTNSLGGTIEDGDSNLIQTEQPRISVDEAELTSSMRQPISNPAAIRCMSLLSGARRRMRRWPGH
jgi:hypothetical protein